MKTSDPLLLTSDDIASASADLQDLQAAALTNANVGKFVYNSSLTLYIFYTYRFDKII